LEKLTLGKETLSVEMLWDIVRLWVTGNVGEDTGDEEQNAKEE